MPEGLNTREPEKEALLSEARLAESDAQLEEAAAIYEQLPPEERQAIVRYVRRFSGPLPSPEMLEEYERVVPGCAKGFVDNMAAESQHRREMEREAMSAGRRYVNRGLWMAFSIAIGGILLGFTIALLVLFMAEGAAQVAGLVSGTVLSGVSIVALVRKFIDGPRESQNSLEDDEEGNEPDE